MATREEFHGVSSRVQVSPRLLFNSSFRLHPWRSPRAKKLLNHLTAFVFKDAG